MQATLQPTQPFFQTQFQQVAKNFTDTFIHKTPVNLAEKVEFREVAKDTLKALLGDFSCDIATETPILDAWLTYTSDTVTLLRSLVEPGGGLAIANIELASYCISELYEMSEAFVFNGKAMDMRPTLKSYLTAFE